MSAKPHLHGRPLTTAKLLRKMADGPREGQSRRAWGREVIAMVRELAWDTNLKPDTYGSLLPLWLVRAIDRERKLKFLAGCGVEAQAA